MVQSDALSRQPDLCPKDDNDNENRILLPDNLFVNAIDLELHNLIASNGREDDLMKNTRKALQEKNSLPLNSKPTDWKIEDDLLFYKDKCYVPDNLEIHRKITELYHDTKPTGHPGQLQTQELI